MPIISSYISGEASIRMKPTIELPPRTTSLNFRQIILQSPTSSLLSFFEDDFEEIDLSDDDHSYDSSSISTVDDISHTILSTLELYKSSHHPSSLSIGNASIVDESKKKSNRFSRTLSKLFYSQPKNVKRLESTLHTISLSDIQLQKPQTVHFSLLKY